MNVNEERSMCQKRVLWRSILSTSLMAKGRDRITKDIKIQVQFFFIYYNILPLCGYVADGVAIQINLNDCNTLFYPLVYFTMYPCVGNRFIALGN